MSRKPDAVSPETDAVRSEPDALNPGAARAEALLPAFRAGEVRAVARALSLVERGDAAGSELLKRVRPQTGRARVVGLTGSPGSGKSTLSDALIGAWRENGLTVAVVAVDPTSPYSGGAILGDRIRMLRWYQDDGVFIRSMATRGHLGGLAAATLRAVALFDAAGYDRVLIETVGVGQSEVDVADAADSTVVVLTPGQGDGVQAFKAGIMEIGDVFCVNKADLPGADRVRREVRAALDLAPKAEGAWRAPIVATVASTGDGVGDLVHRLDEHHAFLASSGALEEARRRRVRAEVMAVLTTTLKGTWERRQERAIDEILAGRLSPLEAVERLWREDE